MAMYLDFYGLKEKPFGLTPDTRFLFLSRNHQEVFAHLWYGLHQGSGFIALSGEIGTGKTTMLRALLARLDDNAWRSALIFNPPLTATSLLHEILREFGLPCDDEEMDPAQLVRSLNEFLLKEAAAGFSVLLILDEAQNLQPEVLEEIRLLSNLETESRKLLHIILAGQPELRYMLKKPELRQLDQRISVRYHSQGMDEADTCRYIRHRIKCAGGGETTIFHPKALRKIFRYSKGVPRLINILCDRSLLLGFTSSRKLITSGMVSKAISELQSDSGRFSQLVRNPALQLFCLVSLLLSQAVWILSQFLWAKDTKSMTRELTPAEGKKPFVSLNAGDNNTLPLNEADRDQAFAAFDAMALAWNVPVLTVDEKIAQVPDLWSAARARGLKVSRVRGSLAALLQLNYPVLIKERETGRLIAILEEREDGFMVAPSATNQHISFSGLTAIWNGEAFLFWRNPMALSSVMPGSGLKEVKALQELLKAAGKTNLKIDGIYGAQTSAALTSFQRDQGLDLSDTIGMPTLLRLYQKAKQFEVPELQRVP